jgi:hypothetical protein
MSKDSIVTRNQADEFVSDLGDGTETCAILPMSLHLNLCLWFRATFRAEENLGFINVRWFQ